MKRIGGGARRSRRRTPDLVSDVGFSTRRVISLAVAMALILAVWPVGVRAATTFLNVFITDPVNTSQKARVYGGALKVTGNVNVTGLPKVGGSVQLVPTDPVSGTEVEILPGPFDPPSQGHVDIFEMPAGEQLIVEFVSVRVWVPSGQVATCALQTGGPVEHPIPLVPQGSLFGDDAFVGVLEGRIYVDGAGLGVFCQRSGGGDDWMVHASFSGYLVDMDG